MEGQVRNGSAGSPNYHNPELNGSLLPGIHIWFIRVRTITMYERIINLLPYLANDLEYITCVYMCRSKAGEQRSTAAAAIARGYVAERRPVGCRRRRQRLQHQQR